MIGPLRVRRRPGRDDPPARPVDPTPNEMILSFHGHRVGVPLKDRREGPGFHSLPHGGFGNLHLWGSRPGYGHSYDLQLPVATIWRRSK